MNSVWINSFVLIIGDSLLRKHKIGRRHSAQQPFEVGAEARAIGPGERGRDAIRGEERAKEHDLMLIRAAEITRNTPAGHFNALFVNDIIELSAKTVTLLKVRLPGAEGPVDFAYRVQDKKVKERRNAFAARMKCR